MKDASDTAGPLVLIERRGRTARLTLNNPGAMNALSHAMLAALKAALDGIAADSRVKVVILGANGRAFSAGHDLKEITAARRQADGGRAEYEALFRSCAEVMLTIRDMPQPVIAEVQGVAAAAGCQLAATCDMVVASTTARFGVNGVDIGLFCSTPMVALSRAVGRKTAFEMLTTGRFLSAGEARTAGLVNHVTAPEDLIRETEALAAQVAAKLLLAVREGKRAFYRQLEMGLDEAYEYTSGVIVENMLFRETGEGISAFLEKRPPAWED